MERHRPTGRTGLGIALAGTTTLLWGVLPHLLEGALEVLDPVTLTGVRFAISAGLLGALLAMRGALPRRAAFRSPAPALLVAAVLGLSANYLGYVVGLDLTSPATAQVLIQLAPLLLALGSLRVFGERFSPGQWGGFAVLVAGLLLFTASQLRELAEEAVRYARGAGVLFLAALTWAGYGLAQKQLLLRMGSAQVMLCLYAGCAALFLPASELGALLDLDALHASVVILCGLNTLLAYGAFAAALEHWEASRVSAVLALTPVATVALGAVLAVLLPGRIRAEHLSAASLLGATLVVGGSIATSLAGDPRRRDAPFGSGDSAQEAP